MDQIGPYQIQGELGRGGMGIVYRGLDPVIGRTVAVKTVRSSDLGDSVEQEKLKDRLFREAKSAGMLSHPGIVTIYQAGQDKDVLFIAMEFIDGPNLADALARTRPSVELTLQILKQAAEALDYAHSKGVIHRDIKPANLLLQSEGRVKVADFGIAKIAATNLTRTGTTVGSPAYMSPEQIRAMAMDGRADQYSLGIVAYEMLTGLRPYDSDTITSLVFKVVFEQPDLAKLDAVPGGRRMDPVFRKVLAKTADERFPTCTAFWQALSDAASGKDMPVAEAQPAGFDSTLPMNAIPVLPTPNAAPPPPPPPPKPEEAAPPPGVAPPLPQFPQQVQAAEHSRRGVVMGGLGVLALALGGGGYWMWSTRPVVPIDDPEKKKVEERSKKNHGVGEDKLVQPVLLQKVEPEYTPKAMREGIEGTVRIRIGINEQGRVEDPEILQRLDPGLDRKAIEAVRKWTFKPATVHGNPVPYRVQVELSFVIPK
jgi:TonB family protein